MSFLDKTIALGGASGFGGAWLWSERIGGELMAAVMVIAGSFLIGALAWRAELWSPRSAYRSAARAAPRREKVAAPVVALLLLSTAVGSPAVGVAAAASSTEECSGVDAIIYDMTTIDGFFSMQDKEDHPCSPKYQRDEAIEELKNASAEQEELDIYNAALSQKANNQVFSDVQANYANDSRSIAWMHAESALAECYKEGNSKSVCKSKAKQAIQDYYSNQAINFIERYNVTVRTSKELQQTAENQTDVSSDYVHAVGEDNTNGGDAKEPFGQIRTTSVTLPNGTTHTTYEIRVYGNDDGYIGLNDPREPYYSDTGEDQDWINSIQVDAPNSDYEPENILNMDKIADQYNRYDTLNNDLQNEVDPFVNATWTAFENDEINASDVISRNNLMFRYGTDALNNTNQSLYDSTAALSTMGLATPNVNNTGSMTVVYNNVSYTGMVLAQEAPNGTWETGKTYETSNIGGTVLLATTDGERIDMKGQFTLQEMKNQDGDQINQTSATKVVYRTSNTSEVLDKMERIAELRAQIEATKPKAGGGGTTSSSPGLLDQLAALLGVSVGAAAAVLVGAGVLVFKIYSP